MCDYTHEKPNHFSTSAGNLIIKVFWNIFLDISVWNLDIGVKFHFIFFFNFVGEWLTSFLCLHSSVTEFFPFVCWVDGANFSSSVAPGQHFWSGPILIPLLITFMRRFTVLYCTICFFYHWRLLFRNYFPNFRRPFSTNINVGQYEHLDNVQPKLHWVRRSVMPGDNFTFRTNIYILNNSQY